MVGSSQEWVGAQAAAAWMGPAPEWRQRLVECLHEAAGTDFAVVATSPPGQLLAAQVAVVPSVHRARVMAIFERFLPRVELGPDGPDARAALTCGRPYAPVDTAHDARVAAAMRREVLGPAGLDGFLVAFLLARDGAVLGLLSVASTRPSAELLAAMGSELERVAAVAGRTLQGALDLAAGCGALLPGGPERNVKTLSARERDVVRELLGGLSDHQVAQRLGISEQTVGSHLRRIYGKLGVHSRVELVTRVGPLVAGGR